MATEGESKAQEQARLRRERRNAKIQAGGAERLSKITSLSGRSASYSKEDGNRVVNPHLHDLSRTSTPGVSDPDEVDISTLSQLQARPQQTASIFDRTFEKSAAAAEPGNPLRDESFRPEDPMVSMLQQLLGQADPTAVPPDFANMFSSQPPSSDAEPQQIPIWKIVHTFFAVCLGLYSAVVITNTGVDRSESYLPQGYRTHQIFWIFATLELVLQSTRYFIEKGRLSASGMLGRFAQVLPAPYASYVSLIGRYSIIYSTIASDVMVLVFILGCAAWWRGMVGS